MVPGQGTQFLWQGEGDQKVGARQQRLRLPFNPALALKVLAVRAAAVPAGMRHQALRTTAVALSQHLAANAAATALQGFEGFELAGQNPVLVPGQELGLEAGEDAGQRDARVVSRGLARWARRCR